MRILGVSCFYHDAAAALIEDGRIVAAAEEERFSRRKHDSRFPSHAIRYCLEAGGISPAQLDHVVFYEKPLLKFQRILSGCAATFPRSRDQFVRAMQTWLTEKLWAKALIRKELAGAESVLFGEHHVSHAASAFYPSPFKSAAIVTADGVGEWATCTLGYGDDLDLEVTHEIRYPHSLGLLYSAFTAYLGFEVNEGEYKVMGMAAYGRPTQVDKVRRIVRLAEDGSFQLDMRYFGYHRSVRSLAPAFIELFGPPRQPESPMDERYADVAASIQAVTEDAMYRIARRARELTGSQSLCLAGGVALNVLANSRILREAGFSDVWVQPAAGDSGGCVGAALYVAHAALRFPRTDAMEHAYLGPAFEDEQVHRLLDGHGIGYRRLAAAELPAEVARLIAAGEVVGWFQGRMEFGPRALGARSILADPTDPGMKDRLNEKIKHREDFRPFAPSVLDYASDEYFEFAPGRADVRSPFMLLVARVRPDRSSAIPAVTHVDGTARVQTVRREHSPLFYDTIEEFGRLKGVPMVVNTSFNVRGEPIVCTPAQAFNSFSHTDMDWLVMGDALISAGEKRRLGPYPGRRPPGDAQEVIF